jgi:FlaA1/EpsC-like NDP-sugar epimerase
MEMIRRQWGLIVLDIVMLIVAVALALFLRFEGDVPQRYIDIAWKYSIPMAVLGVLIFAAYKMYINLWRYASIDEFLTVIAGVSTYCLAVYIVFQFIPDSLPRSIYVLQWFILVAFISGSRFVLRAVDSLRPTRSARGKHTNVLVIGAGSAGSMVIKELREHPELRRVPVAVIDEDRNKWKTRIHSIPVVGGMDMLQHTVDRFLIGEIIIAIPSASEQNILDIINQCKETGCRLRRLPGVYKILDGQVSIKQIQDVKIEDLLGRPPVTLDTENISAYISGKVVLVTGAGGSIGSELCRQISEYGPQFLIMLDIYENNMYELQLELERNFPDIPRKVLIGSVRDEARIDQVFSIYRPHIVFHAAAHKHVPLMEDSPGEAIKNNVLGTINVAEAANRYKVQRFVLISTDKAVNPTNVMGASKRAAELVVQHLNKNSQTEYVAVRFGNVLGSNGSVIPIFQRQIAAGGPVQVTHPEVTRYFMTIQEAVQLVLQASAMAKGGEIFVLDMGKPVKILDLARDLIKLSGFKPDVDIPIQFIGLRPGEKLYEELHLDDESVQTTCHDKIFVLKNGCLDDLQACRQEIDKLRATLLQASNSEVVNVLRQVVPSFKPAVNHDAQASSETIQD